MNELPQKVESGEETAVQIAPYGTYENGGSDGKRHRQTVDEKSVQTLLENFGGEVLVDADHESELGGSTEALAWITALSDRGPGPEGGLWGAFRWTDAGAEAVTGRRFRFVSAAWEVDEKDRPLRLISCALTNKPAIPAKPILNSATATASPQPNPQPQPTPNMDEIKAALGLAPDADEAAILEAVQALKAKIAEQEEAALNAEAEAFADEHKERVENRAALVAAYKKDPALVRETVLNMKAPAPAPAPAAPAPVVCNAASAKTPDLAAERGARAGLNACRGPAERIAYIRRHASELAAEND